MKCAKLHLQERLKPRAPTGKTGSTDRVRRYCQKRMVDPDHDEDPRWNVMKRFYCNKEDGDDPGSSEVYQPNKGLSEDLFLSVQTLKFQGDVKERKRQRNCFKYKSITNGNRHRMFVKQTVEDIDKLEDDRSSEQTSYYFDDYVKYILNDRSRPSTGKSSICGRNKENIQVEPKQGIKNRKPTLKSKPKGVTLDRENLEALNNNSKESVMGDTKITYHKSGKCKSLTISKAQSPETVQVIRVDVVCNYNYSSAESIISEHEEKVLDKAVEKNADKNRTKLSLRNNPFADKYLLTKTVKSLDENISGGKVTLLCKTFKLTDRNIHSIERKSINDINKLYRFGNF